MQLNWKLFPAFPSNPPSPSYPDTFNHGEWIPVKKKAQIERVYWVYRERRGQTYSYSDYKFTIIYILLIYLI